jgi:hypothetical protein
MTSVHEHSESSISVYLILHFLSSRGATPAVSFRILLYIFHMHKCSPFSLISTTRHPSSRHIPCVCFTYPLYPVRVACLRISLLIGVEHLLWCHRLSIRNWGGPFILHQLLCGQFGQSLSLTPYSRIPFQTGKRSRISVFRMPI